MSGTSFVRVSKVLDEAQEGTYFFLCPGCKLVHGVNTKQPGMPKWEFDGNLESPTFSPSILVRYNWGPEQMPVVCHSFVRAGQIQFLSDCTHELSGQTVSLPDLDDEE